MKISVHIHSEYSEDAKQTVSSIIERCCDLGFDAIAITDHNTAAGSLQAAGILANAGKLTAEGPKPPDIKVITGAEFSTDKGHILALFINNDIEKSCRKLGNVYDFEDLVLKVRHQGGLLFLAHPLESKAPDDPSFVACLDGYELVNGRINSGFKNKHAKELSEILKVRFPGKALIGGSDAHTKAELGNVFMTSCAADIKEGLLHADTIHFAKSSIARMRWSNIANNRNRRLKFYLRQTAAMIQGLFYDLGNRIRGKSYEVIRVREETE